MGKAEKTKNYIIERTASIFAAKGYTETSLTDVMQATGLTKGGIYGNFTNKEELALAVFEFNLNKLTQRLVSSKEKVDCFRKKLLCYAESYERSLENDVEISSGCGILSTAQENRLTNAALGKRAVQAAIAWKDGVIEVILNGIKSGELSPSINPEKTALTLIALIEGGMMVSGVKGDGKSWRLIKDSIGEYINSLTLSGKKTVNLLCNNLFCTDIK